VTAELAPFRVLVTGSRDWDYPEIVEDALTGLVLVRRPLVVVHGRCPTGADAHAAAWVRSVRGRPELGVGGRRPVVSEEPYGADWSRGRKAGPLRNETMIAAGADMCLAFIRDGSVGATHCAGLARRHGIRCELWTRAGRSEYLAHARRSGGNDAWVLRVVAGSEHASPRPVVAGVSVTYRGGPDRVVLAAAGQRLRGAVARVLVVPPASFDLRVVDVSPSVSVAWV
jgi:hypothetical protein